MTDLAQRNEVFSTWFESKLMEHGACKICCYVEAQQRSRGVLTRPVIRRCNQLQEEEEEEKEEEEEEEEDKEEFATSEKTMESVRRGGEDS